MKIVDEKGKIFGKLNIIDLLVVILIIAAVALVGLKLMGHNGKTAGPATTLTYTVAVKGVLPEVYENLKGYLPDQVMANGELADASIIKAEATPHEATATISDAGGNLVIPVDAGTLDVVFTIEAQVANTTTNLVGTQEVRIGKSHIVKTVHFELYNGTILSCDWQTPPVN